MESLTGMSDLEAFKLLGTALALGLLIGLERGWHGREMSEGRRIAGIRTFALIGLLGGLFTLLSAYTGMWLLGVAYAGLLIVLIAAYVRRSGQSEDVGITSLVAALLTFGLGSLAVMGSVTVAVSAAIFTALILGLKPVLHDWVLKMDRAELYATLKLLLISVVVLPVLPDKGYGPLEALNPYQIWWMVVLIASISFAGYFAMKIGGARHGALLTGVLGGLAASTAVTLSLSRLAGKQAEINNALAAGILAACGTMFPRTLLIASILNIQVFWSLLPPLLVMGSLTYLTAYIFWLKARNGTTDTPMVQNPFQISMALQFGALLALILVLAKFLKSSFGEAGIYSLSAASALTDVDAITLSMSRMSPDEITIKVAVTAIIIATAVNSLFKGLLSLIIGSSGLGVRVSGSLLLAVLGGVLTILIYGL